MLLVSACSLVNQFDELDETPPSEGGSGGGGNTANNGGNPSDAGASHEGGTPSAAAGEGGGGGTKSGSSGSGGSVSPGAAGAGGEPPEQPDAGMLLIGARIAATSPIQYQVVAMSPESGRVLSREDTNRVLAIAYDDTADEPDIWFVFLANDSGSPLDPASLSIRRYDEADGTYEVVGSLEDIPAPVSPESIAVLNQRLLYRSQIGGGTVKNGFTLIDTSKLDEPQLRGMDQSADLANLVGLLAHPSSAAGGGSVSLITQNNADCVADPGGAAATDQLCPVKARRATVSESAQAPSIDPDNKAVVVGNIAFRDNVYRLAGWTSGVVGNGQRDVFIFPPDDFQTDAAATISVRDPATFAEDKTFKVNIPGRRIPSIAFDPCRQIVLATENNDARSVFAITTADGGQGTVSQALGHIGGRVLYDQYTKTVFTTFEDASNPTIDAWSLNGTDTAPTFKARPRSGANRWVPDADVNPLIVAVKTPPDPLCD